jgi:hypothetical protein
MLNKFQFQGRDRRFDAIPVSPQTPVIFPEPSDWLR